MKRVFLIATLLFCLLPSRLTAAVAADDQYISIFNMIMMADKEKESGQGRRALELYLEAERDLKKLKSAYSTWNSKIVSFRLKYLADRIGPLKVQYPGTTIPEKKGAASGGAKAGAKGPQGVNGALRDLNSKLIDTNEENARLRDQLREALAARPAEADPVAYAKAQEKIRTLQQGVDVSSITMDQQKTELQQLREDYNDLQKRMTVLASRSKEDQLREENGLLKQQVAQLQELTRTLPNMDEVKRRVSLLETDLKNAEAARQSLAAQNQQLQQQIASADTGRLNAENAALKEQVAKLNQLASQVGNVEAMNQRLGQVEAELKGQKSLNAELTRQNKDFEMQIREGDLPRLKAENQSLKVEVAKLNQIAAKVPDVEKLRGELASAQAKVQAEQALRQSLVRDKQKLESLLTDPNLQIGSGPTEEYTALEKEKKALEAQLKSLAAEQKKTASQSADAGRKAAEQAARLEQLERERVELRKALEKALQDVEAQKRAASKAASAKSSKPAEDPQLKKKLQVAEAKIQALEARAEPYSVEELALIRAGAGQPAAASPAPPPAQSKREFPANAGQIALEAQRAYNSQRYAEAETKFKDVLQLEKDNVFTLANLAATQMELNKLAEAEQNLTQALKLQPNDAFSLSLKGLVKFRQNDFDAALDLLSQAAVLDPKNAQTQNYLGLALSQKGLRIAAEAAFRKAVKLAPDYTVAHYNLAVFYATSDAPSPELARWHYQKALAAGHPKSAELEKMLAGK